MPQQKRKANLMKTKIWMTWHSQVFNGYLPYVRVFFVRELQIPIIYCKIVIKHSTHTCHYGMKLERVTRVANKFRRVDRQETVCHNGNTLFVSIFMSYVIKR